MIIDQSVSLTAVLSFPYSPPDMNVRGQNRCDKDRLKTYVIYCIRNLWMTMKQIFINVLISISISCFFDKCSQAKRLKSCILYVVSQIRTKITHEIKGILRTFEPEIIKKSRTSSRSKNHLAIIK